jgi:two-component system, NtrC family, nitrogen regulation sensor histidine kinase NtrY
LKLLQDKLKVKKHTTHIFLLLSLLLLGATFLVDFFSEKGTLGASDSKYLSSLRTRIKEEIAVSQYDMSSVAERIVKTQQFSFADLKTPSKYPYYVYKNHNLVYWSDHRFIPDSARIFNVNNPQLIDFQQGKFIINRRSLNIKNDVIDVFSAINLRTDYKRDNNYLQSGYNTSLFTTDPQQISTKKTGAYQTITDDQNRFLFSVIPPKLEVYRNQTLSINTVFLAILSVLFFGIYIWQWVVRLSRQHNYEWSFILLASYLAILRIGMLYFNIPSLFYETDVFNPKFYVSSKFAPSLGDLLLNCIAVFVLSLYFVDYYYRSKIHFLFTRSNIAIKRIVAIVSVVLSYWAFYACFSELESIYDKSNFSLDITLSIEFSSLKWVCISIFICISSIYFLVIHILSNVFIRFNGSHLTNLLHFSIGTAIGLFSMYITDIRFDILVIVHAAYFILLYFSRFPRILYAFRYRTSIYYFLAALFCSIITTYIVYQQEQRKDVVRKQEFGKQLIAENDQLGEFLLDQANTSIRKDIEIQHTFQNASAFLAQKIQEKVKSTHLGMYFDHYNIEVVPFSAKGEPLDVTPYINSPDYESYSKPYRKLNYKTIYPSIFFVNGIENNFNKEYISLIDIQSDTSLLGHVVLYLKPRNEFPKSVYPELLMEKRFIQAPETRQYSYAVYDAKQHLLLSTGSYNYERKLPTNFLKDPVLYIDGILYNDYKHVGDKGKNGRQVVVSSREYTWKNVLSNFSFLYLILVLYVILIIIFYAINYGFSKLKVNYTTKIQILLNAAFFLPLSLVVVIMLSIISSNYVTNQEAAYLNNTKTVATNFQPYLEETIRGARSKGALEEELGRIARDADLDVNFFDTKGRLYTSTKQLIFEEGLLSKHLNPEGYQRLLEDKENEVLLAESLGNNQYQTAYVSIKSAKGTVLGVLGVPYFDSKPELDRQIIEVISSVLSVFAIMFLLFLLLSYWASNILTVPLRMITQKIRKINLHQLNQPLEWKSDDEIGLMIGAYNQMLRKLEDSKQELAESEKVAAWREMARQVAHEIKNPLTPMKLTIQQIQRTTYRDMPNSERLNKTFDSLIDQIDTISDIATSFSDFAKMPLPKNELFEITVVLEKAANLYAEDRKIVLHCDIQAKEVFVMGDRQLTGRIITNLIINGIQSVPTNRQPEITLKLHTDEGNVYVEVRDNGVGIAENIRNRVFLPNFTTRETEGGTGLGLAIAKRGIEQAGGTIWFESEEDSGSSFFVSLPIANTRPK